MDGHLGTRFHVHGRRLAVVFGLLLAFACRDVVAAQAVTLWLSEPGGIYQEAASAVRHELARDSERWSVQSRETDDPTDHGQEGVVVTLGVNALQQALATPGGAPVLALLVPRLAFEKLIAERPAAGRHRPVSALYLDQPFARQLQLIRLALPQTKRVGVLVGPATESQSDDLRKAGREIGLDLRIHAIRSREQLFSALDALAPEVDVLLLLPDPLVVARGTLQTLFLHTYRQRLPMVAYSSGLVQAGALLGLYTTPGQLGREAGQWLRELARQGAAKPLAPRQPAGFTVEVNPNVARSLDLRLPSGEALGARLEAEEGR